MNPRIELMLRLLHALFAVIALQLTIIWAIYFADKFTDMLFSK